MPDLTLRTAALIAVPALLTAALVVLPVMLTPGIGAPKDPDVDQAKMQKLVDKLDETFHNFNRVEDTLWKQVKP